MFGAIDAGRVLEDIEREQAAPVSHDRRARMARSLRSIREDIERDQRADTCAALVALTRKEPRINYEALGYTYSQIMKSPTLDQVSKDQRTAAKRRDDFARTALLGLIEKTPFTLGDLLPCGHFDNRAARLQIETLGRSAAIYADATIEALDSPKLVENVVQRDVSEILTSYGGVPIPRDADVKGIPDKLAYRELQSPADDGYVIKKGDEVMMITGTESDAASKEKWLPALGLIGETFKYANQNTEWGGTFRVRVVVNNLAPVKDKDPEDSISSLRDQNANLARCNARQAETIKEQDQTIKVVSDERNTFRARLTEFEKSDAAASAPKFRELLFPLDRFVVLNSTDEIQIDKGQRRKVRLGGSDSTLGDILLCKAGHDVRVWKKL